MQNTTSTSISSNGIMNETWCKNKMNTPFIHPIDENIILYLNKNSSYSFLLYFTDKNNKIIQIPSDIYVFIYSGFEEEVNHYLEPTPNCKSYLLFSNETFCIGYKNKKILNIEPMHIYKK